MVKKQAETLNFGGLLGYGPVMPLRKGSPLIYQQRRKNSCTASGSQELISWGDFLKDMIKQIVEADAEAKAFDEENQKNKKLLPKRLTLKQR